MIVRGNVMKRNQGSQTSQGNSTTGIGMQVTKRRSTFSKLYEAYGANLLSASAIIISLYTLYDSNNTQIYLAAVDSLKTEYSLYQQQVALQHDNPLLTYLFTSISEDYFNTRAKIRDAISKFSTKELITLSLQERAVVNSIYTAYEGTFYQWQVASQADEKQTLTNLFEEHLSYFRTALCNSRLVWYWSNSDAPFRLTLGTDAVSYYERKIKGSCAVAPDPTGPFGDQ